MAMEIRTFGDICRAKALPFDAKLYYQQAFLLEESAANLALEDLKDAPTTKYVLLRSAAALAYKAGLFKESERVIEVCKAYEPPQWILSELADIEALIQAERTTESAVEKTIAISGKLSAIDTNQKIVTLNDQSQIISIVFNKNQLTELLKYFDQNIQVEAKELAHGVMVLERIKTAA